MCNQKMSLLDLLYRSRMSESKCVTCPYPSLTFRKPDQTSSQDRLVKGESHPMPGATSPLMNMSHTCPTSSSALNTISLPTVRLREWAGEADRPLYLYGLIKHRSPTALILRARENSVEHALIIELVMKCFDS